MIARPERRRVTRCTSLKPPPLVAASADQRAFLIVYERPGVVLSLLEVYELAGMAVVA
jgi:hypothetical protein